MKIKKKVQGHDIILDYIKVKKYNNYSLYDVYKGKTFLYKSCLTRLQLKEIKKAGYFTDEEVFE